MKQRWMRRVAVILVLCLLFNDNLTSVFLKTQAEEQDAPVASLDVSGNGITVSQGDIGQESVSENELPDEMMTFAMARAASMNLPSTESAYKQAVSSGTKTFYISTNQDFLNAQTFCNIDGFAGITLIVASPGSSGIWDMASITGFTGIGTANKPFRGTLTCGYENGGGIQFQIDKPIIAYMGDDAVMAQMDIVCNGSVSAIAQNINGNIILEDLWIRGTIGNGSGTVGLFASSIESDSSVTISNSKIKGSALTINGDIAGGFAGTAGDNVTINWNSSADFNDFGNNVVTGTTAAGGCFGTVTGSYTFNVATQQYYPVQVSGAGYFGQVAGMWDVAGSSKTLAFTGGNEIEVNLSAIGDASTCGGLVGHMGTTGSDIIEMQISVPDGGLSIAGTMDGNASTCGGVVGRVSGTGPHVMAEFKDFTIDVAVKGQGTVGGLIGRLGWGKYIIKNVDINGQLTGGTIGGLIGAMDCVAVELGENIVISQKPSGSGNTGLLVGERYQQCLMYLAKAGTIDNTVTTSVTGLDEIGGGGNVFRNQTISGGVLIGNGTLSAVGYVNGRVSTSDGWYQLKSAADFECLAIVLSTRGCHGCEAFELYNFSAEHYASLLAGNYEVTNNVDISYENTGIVTLDYQFIASGENEADYAFSGNMRGKSSSITITQNSSLKMEKMGVFSSLSGNNTFSNLTFAGTVTNAEGVGGIAYQTFGSGLTLENITMQKTFSDNTGIIGGVLAVESGSEEFTLSADNIVLTSAINAGPVLTYSGFVTQMDLVDISINNVVIGGSISDEVNAEKTVGAFLGQKWTLIGGKIVDVTVQPGTTLESGGSFAALIGELTTHYADYERLTLDTVKLANLTVNVLHKQKHCGLLIQDADYAVVEVIDYDSTGCVVNNPYTYFDEVAGTTKSSRSDPWTRNTGIISLHSRENSFPEYHYENKVESLKNKVNKYTMYYYDVFQILENEDGSVKDAAKIDYQGSSDVRVFYVDTPEKVLLWNLATNTSSNVTYTFQKYFVSNKFPSRDTQRFVFTGELDLSNICIYPITRVYDGTYSGTDNATFIFGATEEMAEWGLSNVEEGSQHYAMQSGLFGNTLSSSSNAMHMSVSDITLSGQIANLGANSGVLMVGEKGLNGGGTYTNITLDNLRIAGYGGEAGGGLLISAIPDNKVTFENIQMINYSRGVKAASALIGSAGSDAATNLTLRFSKMKIADDVNGGRRHNGDALQHASLLYSYDYTDDAEINTGSGIYLFSEADAKGGIVTYGSELTGDTEFSDTSNSVLSTMGISAANYIPYVYTTEKKIEINPKTGDILKGCGTYEDPYIIEDAKQFLTLYRYINEKGTAGNYQYESFYSSGNGWKMIKPGTDADNDFCATKHEVTWNSETSSYEGSAEHVEDVVTFGDAEFPTPEELSHAYYQLGADIDLSAVGGDTYKTIADEFVGFGTDTRPFVGVWYGAGHTITLPDKADKTYSNYGFIQYAQGAVVKDITIEAASTELANAPTITGAAGSVIATILGGDNIIDNVTVQMALNAGDVGTPVGGYVGVVKKGGLILRNVQTTDVSKCVFNRSYSENGVCGAIVGKVEDGYVVHQGSGSNSVIWQGITQVNGYAAVPGYSILNADALEKSELSLTKTTEAQNSYKLLFRIPDAEGLQIMSMALNSDALNIRPSNHWSYKNSGYSEKARCRKAQYNAIGTTTMSEDYVAAAKYDNVMGYSDMANRAFAYPYLYDLMGITRDDYWNYLLAWEETYTFLNSGIDLGGNLYHVVWELAEEKHYDMTRFGQAFRGIGALYQTGDGKGGTFHGDFDGNNSTINLQITRNVLSSEVQLQTVARAGLFNTLWCNHTDAFVFKDFTITGTIEGTGLFENMYNGAMGGLAACLNGSWQYNSEPIYNYTIQNVTIGDETSMRLGAADTTKQANLTGGLVGVVDANAKILIQGCKLTGSESATNAFYSKRNVGGLIGEARAYVTIEDVQAEYMDIVSSEPYGNGNAGGLLGYVSTGPSYLSGTENNPISVSNSTITGSVAGGMIGQATASMDISYVACENSTIGTEGSVKSSGGVIGIASGEIAVSNVECVGLTMNSYRDIGGVIGYTGENANAASIQAVVVRDLLIEEKSNFDGQPEGLGGVVGRNGRPLLIENAQVLGTKTLDVYDFRIRGSNQQRTNVQGVGGLVGCHNTASQTLTLKDCTIDTLELFTSLDESSTGNGQNLGVGGIVGMVSGPIQLDSEGTVRVQNLDISVPLDSEVSAGKMMAAGGGFGYITYLDSTNYGKINCGIEDDAYTAISITETKVSGKYAGGFIGSSEQAAFNIKNVQITDNNVTSDKMAGGFAGYLKPYDSTSPFELGEAAGKEGYTHAQNITVENNTITAKTVGGFIGGYEADTTLAASIYDTTLAGNVIAADISGDVVTENPAVGGLIGRTIGNASAKNAPLHCDGIYMANSNQIGVRQSGSDTVQLVQTDGNAYRLGNIAMPAKSEQIANRYNALDALEQEFGCFVGTFVGVWESANVQMYVTDSKEANGKFVFPVMASNPPVVDVGRKPEQSVDAYRNNCHILYGAENAISASESKHLADMKTQVEAAQSEYSGTESYTELLTELRASQDAVEIFELSYRDHYQFPGTDLNITFPMLVYRVQNGTLQEVMEHITDIMTNVAGNSASDMRILSIQCTPKLFDGTNFTNGSKASISATVTDGVATYAMAGYDGVVDQQLSYTEITFTYRNNGRVKTYVIPVFVEEPILYSVHSKIMEGSVSDVSSIRQNGTSEENNNIIMANDSNYTLLLEYTYGQARGQMVDGVSVDKIFYFEQNEERQPWPIGTQLLLIDVTGGNKPYYYTVEDADVKTIEFTDFRDSSGQNAYQNPSINTLPDETDEGQDYYTDLGNHPLENTAVERYLLTVLSNNNDASSKVYSLHAGLSIADKSLEERFQLEEEHKEETVWNITAIPGLTVSLLNKGSDTDIGGSISKTDGITIKATFALQAKDNLYWIERNKPGSAVIDSSNSAKYLEVAFYLRDESGNRVALPAGTNFSYKLAEGSDSANRIIADNSIVYYYKDIRTQFGIEESQYLLGNINSNTIVPVEFNLDFGGADLSTVLDDNYVGWIELLRTGNRDYPMGNGNSVDTYYESIAANAMRELGFALRADNMETLAINTYPEPSAQNTIPGHIMFDFSENLELAGTGEGKDLVLEKWSSLNYEVTYQLKKKTENGYVAYTGENLPIRISTTDDQTGMSKESATGSLTVIYNFDKDEIANGNGEAPVAGVLSFPCEIIQNTAALAQETDSLTNYRLEATLAIREPGVMEDVSEKTTDFFVYTVTKLKFDL